MIDSFGDELRKHTSKHYHFFVRMFVHVSNGMFVFVLFCCPRYF